ncbi:MAG: beta-CASP ribonuclease aCPSF1 [Fervidicoccaceae archaeon]|jgi:KH/beta-lactamase-domain protein|uniref:Transcription termination factor FttA n=1 Tax=Fervidicoccus fontis TaxID=683846 RepID=A0A7C2YZJ1_9CREN|nr:MAG: beta-CASP ribonuclease aCPSF1 [Fervidicoccus sp.]HEU97860.1 beta-CASP ribonuclease aCPSF1 [Fervidicoccus fontis]
MNSNIAKRASSIAKLRNSIISLVPQEAMMTSIEFEGPEIAIYVKNPGILLEQMGIIREIAKTIRKRVVIRTDPEIRKSKEEAKKIIAELVPKEAEIKAIEFDEVLGDVIIKAEKPGLVIGKGGNIRRDIIIKTGWRPVIIRAPPTSSKILDGILSQLIGESSYRRSFLRSIGERIHRDPLFKVRGVRITALGGFQEVGRSAILVETEESRILLDAGAGPGASSFPDMAPRFDVEQLKLEELDAVVISHAHLDHVGMLPILFKYGYNGPVYATKATRDIMVLTQLDYLDIMTREGRIPPYTQREIRKEILHTITVEYGDVTDIAPDVRLTLYDAGHILGSAMVHLHIGNGMHNIVYTGDFKYAHTRLLSKANDKFPRVETLIMESTYGETKLPSRAEAEANLLSIIKKTAERGGKTLIPIMSVGRGQEIMLVIAEALKTGALPPMPVYIEGMVTEVTAIHTHYPELMSPAVERAIHAGENPFYNENFIVVQDRDKRQEIAEGEPSVILATSGMLNGGPSVEYLKLLAEDQRNSLVFVSFQVEGTLGRKIKDGQRELTLMSNDGKLVPVKVNMEVHSVEGFSGHSDRNELLHFLENIEPKPRNIILNHGEPSAITQLMSAIEKKKYSVKWLNGARIYAPYNLESVLLL